MARCGGKKDGCGGCDSCEVYATRDSLEMIIESLEDAAKMKAMGLVNWDKIMLDNAKRLKEILAN